MEFDAPALSDDKTVLHLYRIAQESVNNAVRHGKASRISIRIDTSDAVLTMVIQDDGCGMSAGWPDNAGQGTTIMRHRASVLGGSLDFETPGEGGVRVICRTPLRK